MAEPGERGLTDTVGLRRTAQVGGSICGLLGLWGLLCWGINRPLLSAVNAEFIPMSPRASWGYLMLGSALLLHLQAPQHRGRVIYVMSAGLLVMAVGALSLGESLLRFGADSTASVFHPPGQYSDYLVARMSRPSAIGLLLGGGGLLALTAAPRKRWAHLAGILGFVISAEGFVFLLGYLYGVPLLYGGSLRPVPLLASVAIFAVGLGLAAAAGRDGFPMTVLTGSSFRARLLRTFLPITFTLALSNELLSDLLRWHTSMNPAMQDSLLTLFSVTVITCVICYFATTIGNALDAAEAERVRSEEGLRRARAELEDRVRERTASLADANEELKKEVERRLRYEQTLRDRDESLRQVAERLSDLAAIVESSEDAIISQTLDGSIASWNRAAQKLYGYREDEVLGRSSSMLIPPGCQDEMLIMMDRITDGDVVAHYETRHQTRRGSLFDISLTMSPVRNHAGQVSGASMIIRDITPRKRLERDLLEISSKERRRLGHNLHDGLGQHLTGIALKAKALEENLRAEGSGEVSTASEVVDRINGAIHQTRILAQGLDPIHVEANGLVAALRKLALQARDSYKVDCQFDCRHEFLRVNAEAGLAFYRIAQEAIRNAAAHGRAPRIDVTLMADEGHIRLRVSDQGTGFVPGHGNADGMGLHMMQYRANSVGGLLSVHSSPGAGTTVDCTVPAQRCLVETGS